MFSSYQRFCRFVNRCVEVLLFLLGLGMALIVAVQVFCRYGLNHSLFWSEELARTMLVWLSFLGASVAYYQHRHPGIDILTRRLGRRARLAASLCGHLVTLGLALVMIVSGLRFSWFVRLQITPALGMPKWAVLSVIPVSGLLLSLYTLLFLIQDLQEFRPSWLR